MGLVLSEAFVLFVFTKPTIDLCLLACFGNGSKSRFLI